MDLVAQCKARQDRRNAQRRANYAAGNGVKEYNQLWKEQNRDRANESSRKSAQRVRATDEGRKRARQAVKKWRDANLEKARQSTKDWFAEHPDYNRQYLAARSVLEPERYLFNAAKRRAVVKRLKFNLKLSDIKIPMHCPVLGIELSFGTGKRNKESPSLDRIDATKGYTKNNIAVISMRANWLKSNGTLAELKAIVAWLEKQS